MSAPEWLVVGADVVEFTQGRMGGTARIAPAKVKTIGKRDVVLDNGSRFPVARLRKSSGTWDPTTELIPANDPRVAKARAANHRQNLRYKADRAYDAWRVDPATANAQALCDAIDAVLKDAGR